MDTGVVSAIVMARPSQSIYRAVRMAVVVLDSRRAKSIERIMLRYSDTNNMDKKWFNIELKNPSRNITRQQWKDIQRYLRATRRIIQRQYPLERICQITSDAMLYGRAVLIDDDNKLRLFL